MPALKIQSVSEGSMAHENGSGAHDDLEELKPFLHPNDLANFLKLCMALDTLIKHTLSDCNINKANWFLCKYCSELIWIYGSSSIKPNYHYATHIVIFVHNFRPLYDF
ncbi:hypothetical protein HD554DRAFT_2173585 [Boletus coccyginus]|nr:hypothetical protein HD554DRAFT_2179095 [Boletus coccyginus]KAI9567248.1 hypothetical protein HD554DRAFT_2173585 [Boletus coccyginus]